MPLPTSGDRLVLVPVEIVARQAGQLQLSRLDRRIIDLALTKVRGTRVDFADAMRALQEAAEEVIPSGRIFFLGSDDNGPIVGSLLSGVGIVEAEQAIKLVRVHADAAPSPLGWFSR
jgi:hypothetical protein